jgi:hypothetical protein
MAGAVVSLFLMIAYAGDIIQMEALIPFIILAVLITALLTAVYFVSRAKYTIEGRITRIAQNSVTGPTTVYFEDGRQKVFQGIPKRPVKTGEYYYIVYNGFDQIQSIEEWNPE